jgi:hypothetical protein
MSILLGGGQHRITGGSWAPKPESLHQLAGISTTGLSAISRTSLINQGGIYTDVTQYPV